MNSKAYCLGLDLGTTGARVVVTMKNGVVVGEGKSMMQDHGINFRDPKIWWATAKQALNRALSNIDRTKVAAICVDGTSGTIIPIDACGTPMADGLMYNDPCRDKNILKIIAKYAPSESAAHGVTSGLAKSLYFQQTSNPVRLVHQADWISGCFSGVMSSDYNNALKTGYDPVNKTWPSWIAKTGLNLELLPEVHEPGTPITEILKHVADEFGLPASVVIVAGTTDGCASFLATGIEESGIGVTALGTSLTIKILSDVPIFDPPSGAYSHRVLGKWLAGGSSNTGGNVLLAHFSREELAELSQSIDPNTATGLDYYPLTRKGERFPVFDPNHAPRLSPHPGDRAVFLQALFEGMANIEAMAYEKITELGGSALTLVYTVGGGAKNPTWMQLRKKRLAVDVLIPENTEAAYGTARLARIGVGG